MIQNNYQYQRMYTFKQTPQTLYNNREIKPQYTHNHLSPYQVNNQINNKQDQDNSQILMKYLMISLELQRSSRLNDQLRIFNYDQKKYIEQLKIEHETVKGRLTHQRSEILVFQSQNRELKNKINKLESILKQKNFELNKKQQQLSFYYQEKEKTMNYNQALRQLQKQLAIEKNKVSQLLRIKNQMLYITQTSNLQYNNYEQSQKYYKNRVQQLEIELKKFKQISQKQSKQIQRLNNTILTLKIQKQTQMKRIQDIKETSLKNIIQNLQYENSRYNYQNVNLSNKIKQLQNHIKLNQDNKKSRFGHEEQINKLATQLEIKIKYTEQLQRKLKQQFESISILQNQIRILKEHKLIEIKQSKDNKQCKFCKILQKQNLNLKNKLQKLSSLFKQSNYQDYDQFEESKMSFKKQENTNSIMSLKQLLQSAKFLKGSNQRISRLLQTSELKQEKSPSNKTIGYYYKKY